MKAITLGLCISWTMLFMVQLFADGTDALCTEEGIFPRTEHCRLSLLCLESKTKNSKWKEYLLACPFGWNFNHFLMSCYNFTQECALEEGDGTESKLADAWSLKVPKKQISCKGVEAPFCKDEKMLTICHPFSKRVLGYVDCKEKDAARSYCDKKDGICKRRTSSGPTTPASSTPNNASNPTETMEDNFQRTVVLCSASLKGAEGEQCIKFFGKEYECLATEDYCPVYVAQLLRISNQTENLAIQANIHVHTNMGNMNVSTVVNMPTAENKTENQSDGFIINGDMKLQKCQKPGGNCLSDGNTLMECNELLRIKHVYRCSDAYGNLAVCEPELQECVVLKEQQNDDGKDRSSLKRKKGGGYNSIITMKIKDDAKAFPRFSSTVSPVMQQFRKPQRNRGKKERSSRIPP